MGNSGSHRRHHSNIQPPPTPPPGNRQTQRQYVFAAASPYPSQYPSQYYPPYAGPYPPPVPLHGAFGYHHMPSGHYPMHPPPPPPPPPPQCVEHQKAVTIRNDVNVKKETLRIEPDEENTGKFLVAFTFDATAPGSITVVFFGKEDADCSIIATKEDLHKPVTVTFEQGLGQKFRQPCGAGIDFSMFDEATLTKVNDEEIYPMIVRAEARPSDASEAEANHTGNSQITMAVFEKKEEGCFHAQVMKQILWVDRVRYELQEIYGIGSTSAGDETDSGKECVICLSEPRDTTVLPCRHMCMCSECAKVLRFQTNRCPICRQPVERLLEIKVNNADDV